MSEKHHAILKHKTVEDLDLAKYNEQKQTPSVIDHQNCSKPKSQFSQVL